MNTSISYIDEYTRVRVSLSNLSFSCGFCMEYDHRSAFHVANFYVDADVYGRFYATTLNGAVNKLMREAGVTRVQQYIDSRAMA